MECRASLIYAQLLSPGLDLDEVRSGQLFTVCGATIALGVLSLSALMLNSIT
jgi:hypothetical protein